MASPSSRTVQTLLLRLAVSAVLTVAFEACIGSVLEFVKVCVHTRGMSYGEIIAEATAVKGLSGLLDGFVPWGMLMAMSKGVTFTLAHSLLKPVVALVLPADSVSARALGGGLAGIVQGFVMCPLGLLKTRVITDPAFRAASSLAETIAWSLELGTNVIATDGLSGLMTGVQLFASKRFFDWTTRFLFMAGCEKLLMRGRSSSSKPSAAVAAVAALLGGILSAAVTNPMDVLVSQAQRTVKSGVPMTALQLLGKTHEDGGAGAVIALISRGFAARAAHVALMLLVLNNAVAGVTDWLKGVLLAPEERSAAKSKKGKSD